MPAAKRQLGMYSIAAVMAAVLFFIVLNPLRVNHDAALYLQIGGRILEGDIPYVDYVEINLPLVHYLHAMIAAIARLVSVHVITVFSLFTALMILYSMATVQHLLASFLEQRSRSLAYWAALPIGVYSIFLLLTNDYGQREHLFFLAVMPWAALRWIRWQGGSVPRWQTIVIGVIAAVGSALKPHFLLIMLVMELYWWLNRRAIRPLFAWETAAYVLTGLVYAVHFLLIPTPMRDALFSDVLPQVAASYGAYGETVSLLQGLFLKGILAISLLGILPFLSRSSNQLASFTRSLGMFTLAALGIYLLQGKGWYYQLIPAGAAAMILLSILIASKQRLTLPRRLLMLGAFALYLLSIAFTVALNIQWDVTAQQRLTEVILENSDEGDEVLVVDTSLVPTSVILTQTGRTLGGTYPVAFPITFAFADDDAISDGEAEYFLSVLSDDLAGKSSEMLLINNATCAYCPAGFQISAWLEQQGLSIENTIEGYTYLGNISLYDVYRRTD